MQFVFLVVLCAISLVAVELARRRQFNIRKLPAIDALAEGIGRAVEMGRPVHFTTGSGRTGLMHQDAAPQILAGLNILKHVVALCGKYGATMLNTISNPDVLPLTHKLVEEGYRTSGHPELFKPDMIRFVSSSQFAYAAGVMATIEREKVATNFMIGAFWAEALMFSETGFRTGAFQIAGTAMVEQISFFVATCDYVLIGEELYAAGAYLSKDPMDVGGIVGEDISRVVVIAFIVVGAIAATFGSFWLRELLSI